MNDLFSDIISILFSGKTFDVQTFKRFTRKNV